MKRTTILIAVAAATLFSACGIKPAETIEIDLSAKGADVSPSMYGVFFEEINHAGDGGLLSELVENRSFEDLQMPKGYHAEGDKLFPPVKHNHTANVDVCPCFRWPTDPVPGWRLEGDAAMSLSQNDPYYASAPTSLKVETSGEAKLINDGFWGMNIIGDSDYILRTIIKRGEGFDGTINARIVAENGEILAELSLDPAKEGWSDQSATFTARGSSSKSSLEIGIAGAGQLLFDYVSLEPVDTYCCANGNRLPLRKDVAGFLTDLHPAFIRWPGGCVVEGISLENRFEWKKTLGDPASRSGEYSTWGYRCSYGFGFHEMLSFCESINAGAMFVCNVGIGCQGRCGDLCSDSETEYYIDDCLDAIEYAIGPVDSEWGSLRAKAGHPEPFPLKYVEIGNENGGYAYEAHYNLFHKAIRAKYPELTLICNYGIGGIGSIEETDMIDPHWYVNPDYFFANTHIFDNLERGRYTAYVGEYAANTGVGSGNMRAALSEAAFIGGMERNGDFVKMCSYAPLFENPNDRVWPVNLIWIKSDQVMGRSSYYVQKLAAENRPDYNLGLSKTECGIVASDYNQGRIGLGTYHTHSEFKDMKVTTPDGTEQVIDLNGLTPVIGNWSCEEGTLSQKATDCMTRCFLSETLGSEYTLEFKARRITGPEGLLLFFGMDENGNGWCYNIGGWGDTCTAVEKAGGWMNDSCRYAEKNIKLIKDLEWQDVRLEVCNNTSKLYVDGEFILEHKPGSAPTCFVSAGYVESSGEVIIKVVNSGSEPCTCGLAIGGASKVAAKGRVIELAAESDTDENSFDQPHKIYPEEKQYKGFGKDFNYTFAPYSYTILRVKAAK